MGGDSVGRVTDRDKVLRRRWGRRRGTGGRQNTFLPVKSEAGSAAALLTAVSANESRRHGRHEGRGAARAN